MSMAERYWRWIERRPNVPWWEFWDPRSGLIGGLICVAICLAALVLLLNSYLF